MTGDQDNDQILLEGILAGQREAIEKTYAIALPSVVNWIKKNSGSEMQARDIFQDAMIALYKRLGEGGFELSSSLKAYLMAVSKNLWLKNIRDNKKTDLVDVSDYDTASMDEDTIKQIEINDRRKLYLKHFDLLGEDCRKILSLFFDSIPYREIATKMKTTEAYIKKRKFKCKEKLTISIKKDPLFDELYQA